MCVQVKNDADITYRPVTVEPVVLAPRADYSLDRSVGGNNFIERVKASPVTSAVLGLLAIGVLVALAVAIF